MEQETEQQAVGVGALVTYLDSRVSALQSLDLYPVSLIAGRRRRLGGVRQFDVRIQSSGAAHIEFALGLGVEIEQDVAAEQSRLQSERAVHARLLGGGEESLYRSMLDSVVLQHRECRCNADTVVGT